MSTLTNAPAANRLGTHNLDETYLTAADKVIVGRLYANLVLAQPALDVSGLDPGLATFAGAYQARMQHSASAFLSRLEPAYISTVTAAANFAALADSAFTLGNDLPAVSRDTAAAQRAATMFNTLAAEAGNAMVTVNSLQVSFNAGQKELATFVAEYDAVLAKSTGLLGEAAKQLSGRIDALQKAIEQNIEDIVQGSEEVGGAVSQLGMGVLTTLSGSLEPPAGDGKDDKEKGKAGSQVPKGTKPPDVAFAVQAIKAGSSGQAKVTAAGQALNANNDKMAVLYQEMARDNTLIAIAKVIQGQNQLLLNAQKQLAPDIREMLAGWSAVSAAFKAAGRELAPGVTQAEADALAADVQQAVLLWQSLQGQLTSIKQFMTGTH